MMQMKASTLEIIDRCEQGKAKPVNGTLPIPKEAQDVLETTRKLQNHITSLEDMEHQGAKEMIASYKADIAKLKPKLPNTDQGLVDQAQALEAIRDVREKKAMEERILKEQRQKTEESKQQSHLNLQQEMKEIDEQAAAQKKKFEEAATKRQEMLEASIVETGKQFAQL